MRSLTVFYDETCGFCLRCRDWLLNEPQVVPLALVEKASLPARYPQLAPYSGGSDLVVVSDEGDVWTGDAAFITVLFALENYRGWARRLAGPTLRPFARRFFEMVSSNRALLSSLFGRAMDDASLATVLAGSPRDPCPGDTCSPTADAV